MNEQQVEQNFIKAKRKKKIWIYLICWPVIIFLLWFIASFIFWSIDRYRSNEQILSIKSTVNWIFWILVLLYIFVLPAWIALTVDANNDLKKLDKDNSIK